MLNLNKLISNCLIGSSLWWTFSLLINPYANIKIQIFLAIICLLTAIVLRLPTKEEKFDRELSQIIYMCETLFNQGLELDEIRKQMKDMYPKKEIKIIQSKNQVKVFVFERGKKK